MWTLPSMWALWRVSNGCDVCCKLCGHYVLSNVWTLCRLCWHCVWSNMWTLCRAQMVVIWSRWHFPHLVAHWLTATAPPSWISNWINPTHDAQTFTRVYTYAQIFCSVSKMCTWMYKYVLTLSDVWKQNLVESKLHTMNAWYIYSISTNFCKCFKAQPNWINPPHDAQYFANTFTKKVSPPIQDQSET